MFSLILNILILLNVIMAVVFEAFMDEPIKALGCLCWAILMQLLLMEKSNG